MNTLKRPQGCFKKPNFSSKFMSIIEKIKNYFLGSYAEMQKVTWPTRNQTVNYSLVVIGLSLGVAIFFGIMDYFLNYGITFLLNR